MGPAEAWIRSAGGAIGVLATSTVSLRSRIYSAQSMGAGWAIHRARDPYLGALIVGASINAYRNLNAFDENLETYVGYLDLLGDPTAIVWTDIPREFLVQRSFLYV